LADELGYPLVMKILSPDITHKSDVGGVRINLRSIDEVRRAFDEIMRSVRDQCPQARIEGVTLQAYVAPLYSAETILGCRRDPIFGPVIMLGMGGVTAELLHDCTFELPPLDEHLARSMLERLRSWPLFTGFRGRPPLAVDRLLETMLRFSTLVVECPEIVECDLNPLVVTTDGVVALDARMTVDPAVLRSPMCPYGHLAVAPYPEQLVRQVTLKDGTSMLLRPLRPDDEGLWHTLVDAASDQSILFRFRSLFRSVVHSQAVRYCFVDYDREMAIVAEVNVQGRRELVAVGRLVADRNHDQAEFGILVIDAWQGRGLGGLLLDLCLQHAREAGYKSVYGEVSWDNQRMLSLFRKRGFAIEHFPKDPTTLRATLAV
jgi:acetyltransferase